MLIEGGAPEPSLRERDRLEQLMLAFGEPVRAAEGAPDLAWMLPGLPTQRLYYWAWALHDGWLYGHLHDQYGRSGYWRLKTTPELLGTLNAVLGRGSVPGR